jgi:hypothetical protein
LGGRTSGAFQGCTSLTNVVIGNSVTSIGDGAFGGCTSLTSIVIPNSVTSIGDAAFWCTSLTAIEVDPANPSYSGLDGVLFNKSQSTLIRYPWGKAGAYTVPDSVTSIGDGAFSGCTSLTSITIPNSVTSIGEWAFHRCSSLTGITVEASNPTYSSLDGVLFDRSQKRLIAYPAGKRGPYAIPDSVTNIGDGAFEGCTGLTSITIPDSFTSICQWAFGNCTSLTSVTIPNSVTSIDDRAFYGCARLTSVYFHGDTPGAGGDVFEGSPAAIVYYRAGTTGWKSTFLGHPTALWIEPPVYRDWLLTTGLLSQYPDATAEADDPDQDGMSNYAEMLAGTDPTDRASLLTLEHVPRPNDLTEADRTAIGATQHALYFRSMPGKCYGVQWAESVDGPWNTTAVVTASTTQKRLVYDKPETHAFYRVILAQ